jgi:Flp pilus assembly pilin Flp
LADNASLKRNLTGSPTSEKITRRTMAIVEKLRALIANARLLDGESGQAMVEYALLLSLIAIVCFGVGQIMGLGLSSLYNSINTRFP